MFVPGAAVPDLRLGVVAQHDFSAGIVHDFGVMAGFKLAIPLGPLRFLSDSTGRFFFEDGDDRQIDLGMVIRSNNRLAVSIDDWMSIFAFADIFAARGKLPGFRRVAGSVITGVGLQLSTNVRL